MEHDVLKQYLIVAAALLLVFIIFIMIYYIFKKTKTFSIVFPVSKPNNGKSTLPGIDDNAVSNGKSTYVELKKKTTATFNVVTLENESGLI
ncbi:Maestro heat-like repeat-containing protein family member [Dirofilaria immitis]